MIGNTRADVLAELGKGGEFSAIGRFQEFALSLATFQRSHQEETDSLFSDNSPRQEDDTSNIEMNRDQLNSSENQAAQTSSSCYSQKSISTNASREHHNNIINVNQDNIVPTGCSSTPRKNKRKKRDFKDHEESNKESNNQDNNQDYSLDL